MSTHLPTLRQLQYLIAVAEEGHFGRAAEKCFVTQSTLSAGIQELEAILGVTVIERTKRRVAITTLGLELVARARRVLAEVEDMTVTAKASTLPLTGTSRLVIFTSASGSTLSTAMLAVAGALAFPALSTRTNCNPRTPPVGIVSKLL